MDFTALNEQIALPDEKARQQAQDRWNNVAKPIGGLGQLEDIIVQVAALTGDPNVSFQKRAIVPFCADNGVIEEGVTQSDANTTAVVTHNMGVGISAIGRMALSCGVQVLPIDVGIAADETYPGVDHQKVAFGTANMAKGPAMTYEQAEQAIQVGLKKAHRLAEVGYRLVGTGEMGIGNSSTSSAIASVLLGLPVQETVGRGAGLNDEMLQHKMEVVEQAIAINHADPRNAFDVLAKLGGFDIAAMVGLYIGCAINRIPVVIDGFVSAIAALIAVKLCPNAIYAMIPSHLSSEPASEAVFDALGMHPIIHAGMHLGEGTGAVCLFPMLDMAAGIYDGMTFKEVGLEPYTDYARE